MSKVVRRNLGSMATTANPPQNAPELAHFRSEITNFGSSYGAFKLALKIRPTDLGELLSVAGVYGLTGQTKHRAFDACVDGYSVFHDGRVRGKL